MDFSIENCETHSDKRGKLIVFLKSAELVPEKTGFGQIYYASFSKKGVVRGNHYHKRISEWFVVVSGTLKMTVRDMRTGETRTLIMSARQKSRQIKIGPYIAHAFQSLSSRAVLLNYSDRQWSKKDTLYKKIL
ncbi:dTDP-4-dehydrorhamnose 3,5-epimerase family protein [Candidatus Roizmanbacteria bacterium]|nr:dTDP-4-dehydrorhamnose 3,5-epimerase family protein [Candidatus Roizmanbacteria bacterium]